VQIYRDADELVGTVADYLVAGFERGQPALVVARPEHSRLFADRLEARGWGRERTEHQGLLLVADAAATLAVILDGDRPSAAGFDRVVRRLLDRVRERADGRRIRVFGEMVDLLVEREQPDAAFALEELWNAARRRHGFSLLCAYRLDVFDRAAQATTLPDVCASHSHVLPAQDAARFSRAVDRALEEVLGPREAGKVYAVVGDEIREGRVPPAQLLLMWASANMPVLADRILTAARRQYLGEADALAAGA
jgi:hypothetical protein